MIEYTNRFKNWNQFLNENYNIKPGIGFLYQQHPELSNIGTQEQYSQYLDTIFPDSKVKDILYHRSPYKFDKFDKSKIKKSNHRRFYFSPFNTGRYGQHVSLVILNIKNLAKPGNDEFMNNVKRKHPEYTEGKSEWFYLPAQIYANADKYGYDGVYNFEGTNDDEYSVYEPEQIHILGSKKDVEGFKNFVINIINYENKINENLTELNDIKEWAYQYVNNHSEGFNSTEDAIEYLDWFFENYINKSDKLKLYRILQVDNKKYINSKNLGIHFTDNIECFSENFLQNLGFTRSDIREKDFYIVTIEINIKDIDWKYTIITRLNHPYEEEITINKNSNFNILSVKKWENN